MKKPATNKEVGDSKRKGKSPRDNIVKKKKKQSSNSDYQKYLKSKEWQETREWFWTNVYPIKKCYFCGREEGENDAKIQLHHNTYKWLRNEKEHIDCLIPICATCHLGLHRLKSTWCRFKKEDNVKDDKEENE